jgi:hypothetical protein
MRLKLTGLGQMKRFTLGKKNKKKKLLLDETTTFTVKHRGGNNLMVWGCMG